MKTTIKLWRPFAGAAAAACFTLAWPAMGEPSEWRFTVRLDDRPIGTHRFTVDRTGGLTRVESDAKFDITFLRVPLYRYRHRASERWSEDCLASIVARTDDNGRITEVQGSLDGADAGLRVVDDGRISRQPLPPGTCLMSFAYWNPALSSQTRLLDPGTGRIEAVATGEPPAPARDLQASGGPLRGIRIRGLAQPIDVWYAGSRWIGLDTVVDGGRHLSYRLN